MGDAAGGQGPTAEVESMELVVKKLLSTPAPLHPAPHPLAVVAIVRPRAVVPPSVRAAPPLPSPSSLLPRQGRSRA